MNIRVVPIEHDPLEIDPRPCGECGLTIDRHRMVDDGEGPEFFCEEAHPYAFDLVRGWELADPRDRWKHTGEAPPKISAAPRARRKPYELFEVVEQAFWYVVRDGDAEYLRRWLARHPLDAPHLMEIWKRKNAVA
jgi:hypothetical protein